MVQVIVVLKVVFPRKILLFSNTSKESLWLFLNKYFHRATKSSETTLEVKLEGVLLGQCF